MNDIIYSDILLTFLYLMYIQTEHSTGTMLIYIENYVWHIGDICILLTQENYRANKEKVATARDSEH